jgi:hypothetical protein
MDVRPPRRVTRRYTQSLDGPPDEVFALLCPVRETEWVNGWNPRLVLTDSGYAEPGCIFVTPSIPQDALWIMTEHDPDRHRLRMLKLVPSVVIGHIEIDLEPSDSGTSASISYSFTSLGQDGDKVLDGFTQEHFDAFMMTWEDELNHYLATGAMLG